MSHLMLYKKYKGKILASPEWISFPISLSGVVSDIPGFTSEKSP